MTARLKHTHIIKLTRLLDMMYRPSEIADEIGLSTETITRSYIPAGLPCTRDNSGSIWIHGRTFAAWARETVAQRKTRRAPLPDGTALCMHCHKVVTMTNVTTKPVNKFLEMLHGCCAICGGTVNRAQKRSVAK